MATKLKRACRYNRCHNLTNDKSGYCEAHKAQAHLDYRKSRTDKDEQRFYGSQAWRHMSLQYRLEHPVCEACGDRPSELVHHKVHVKQGGDRLAKSNLQAVCRSCQAKAHRG